MHTKGIVIEVEGAKLTVCERCKRFGQEVRRSSSQPRPRLNQPPVNVASRTPKRNIKPKPVLVNTPRSGPQEFELVEDYPQRIRRGRERLKATQTEFASRIGERLSIIQKLETGKMWPSDSLVEKIERTLRITLRTPVDDELISPHLDKPTSELTIGDVANPAIKKKTG
jgi:putative transcription factor